MSLNMVMVAVLSLAAGTTMPVYAGGGKGESGTTATIVCVGQNQPAIQPETLEQGFVLVVEDRTGKADAASPIYLASNHVDWNAGAEKMRLTQRSDGRWQIDMPKASVSSRMAFKFTRGSWETVEINADLEDINNRVLSPVDVSKLKLGEKPVIELVIMHWADERSNASQDQMGESAGLEVTGTIRRLQVFGGGREEMMRELLVWLPPGYDEAANQNRRYPILYMQDGQNLFYRVPGLRAEWTMDETATQLIREGRIEPLIIVGIPHMGRERAVEYLPIPVLKGVEAKGQAYTTFVINEIVPRVERAFRVSHKAEDRAIGGSSFGAIIAMEIATRHTELFGKVLSESPSLGIKDGALQDYFSNVEHWPERMFLGMGDSEVGDGPGTAGKNAAYVRRLMELSEIVALPGKGDFQPMIMVGKGHHHEETAWAERLPSALEYLFPSD